MDTRKEVLKTAALAGVVVASAAQPSEAQASQPLASTTLAPPAPNDGANVCHVGVQMHLHTGGAPELFCIRHLRAFVENGMASYVMLVCRGLNDEERNTAVRYLADHKVYFLIQDIWPEAKRQYTPEDYRHLREIGGDLFLGAHIGELDSADCRRRSTFRRRYRTTRRAPPSTTPSSPGCGPRRKRSARNATRRSRTVPRFSRIACSRKRESKCCAARSARTSRTCT